MFAIRAGHWVAYLHHKTKWSENQERKTTREQERKEGKRARGQEERADSR
jgi:hypothetical protein